MEQLPSRFSVLEQALIKQKCNLLKLLITHFDCLLRDSAAPPAVWGLLVNSQLLASLCASNLSISTLNSVRPWMEQRIHNFSPKFVSKRIEWQLYQKDDGNPRPPYPGARICCCRCSLPGLTGFTTFRRGEANGGHH